MGKEQDYGRNQTLSGNKRKRTYNNPKLMGQGKAILRGKFIVMQTYQKKIETFQINNLTLHLLELQEQQTNPIASRRKEIIKIRVELNDIETKTTILRIEK